MMKKSLRAGLKCLVGLLATASVARAEYFGFNVGSGATAIVEEVRYPFWAESTYNAIWSTHLSGNGSAAYFYGGIPEADPNNPEKRPAHYIWTFWPVDKPVNAGDTVQCIWTHPVMYAPLTIGEGASGKASGDWPEFKLKTWYKFVTRVWYPMNGEANATYAGQWFYNPDTKVWQHLATMRAPFSNGTMKGIGGFIEDFSHGNRNPRRTEFRGCYYLQDGKWQAANEFTGSTRQKTEKGDIGLIEDGTAAFFETCSGENYAGTLGPGEAKKTLTLKQPPQPEFSAIELKQVSVKTLGKQALVTWEVPPTSSPQLGYKIELLNGEKVVKTTQENDPEARQAVVELSDGSANRVRLTLIDIFDRASEPTTSDATPIEAKPAQVVDKTADGLSYTLVHSASNNYWGEKSNIDKMPDFSAEKPVLSGIVNGLDLTVRRRRVGYGIQYNGFLKAPETGVYQFWMSSSDGSRLTIDGDAVINADGIHSYAPREGHIALAKGLHPITVEYFHDTMRGEGGEYGDRLQLEWSGPNSLRGVVPVSAFARKPETNEPTITLLSPADNFKGTNAAIRFNSKTTLNGAKATRIAYYVDDILWSDSDLGDKAAATPHLLGVGPATVRARLFYGDNRSADSAPVTIHLTQAPIAPWTFSAIGAHLRKAGASGDATKINMVGDGLNFAWQSIDGDSAIVSHIASAIKNGDGNQDDGTRAGGDWSAGVIFRENLDAQGGTPLGDKFCSLFTRIGDSTHLQCSKDHNGGGPMAGKNLGKSNWLKLQRKGDTFTAFTSEDGKTWKEVGTREVKMKAKLHVGVFTFVPRTYNPTVPRWSFDQVKVIK